MLNNTFLKFKKFLSGSKQKGISLIIAFFVMIIILAIILAVVTLLYNEIKIIRNIGNSVAFYVADSGVEKVLYYDRQIIPDGATRGLCAMFYDAEKYTTACPDSGDMSGIDSGLYCNNGSYSVIDKANLDGCNPDICNSCKITFNSVFPDTSKNYSVIATVTPGLTETEAFNIYSTGVYRNVSRKVELTNVDEDISANAIITIKNSYATPISSPEGTAISVITTITADNGIGSVRAYIKTSLDQDYDDAQIIYLETSSSNITRGTYTGTWTGTTGVYYVDIEVLDSLGNQLIEQTIPPF